MVLIIVILLVSFIVLPLVNLITAERIKTATTIIVLILTLLWEVYELFVVGKLA